MVLSLLESEVQVFGVLVVRGVLRRGAKKVAK
jgi:hypothetical protein